MQIASQIAILTFNLTVFPYDVGRLCGCFHLNILSKKWKVEASRFQVCNLVVPRAKEEPRFSDFFEVGVFIGRHFV